LIWTSPTLPGSRHDIAAAGEHGLLDALAAADVHTVADTGYQGAGPAVRVPQRRRRLDPGSYRRLSDNRSSDCPPPGRCLASCSAPAVRAVT